MAAHSRWLVIVVTACLAGCGSAPVAYDAATLQAWHEDKAALVSTLAGSPEWQAHMNVVEAGMDAAGVIDVERYPAPYTRWWVSGEPALRVADNDVYVASYWAYSGGTPPGGVTAPLVLYEKDMPADDMRGRIVVFTVDRLPASLDRMFSIGHEWATADFADVTNDFSNDQWYQGNFVTRFGRFDRALRDSGAAGGVVVFSMSAAQLDGLYTFPLLSTERVGVPGVYVDADAGAAVLEAARTGAAATLTLPAETADVEPYFYTAVLPGRDYGTEAEREILLVTHSDGPNLTQENGTLGILALVRRFAKRPQQERGATLRVLLDPQHYSPGRHTINWYDRHPGIMAKVSGIVGVEQLGQLEYGMSDGVYGLTGDAEPWQLFVRDDPRLVAAAIDSITRHELPRTELRVPEHKGQGVWTGLAEVAIERDIPGYGTLSGMSGYWTTAAGIESFDADLAVRQLDVLTELIDELAARP